MAVDLGVARTVAFPGSIFPGLHHHSSLHVRVHGQPIPPLWTDRCSPESPRWLVHEGYYEEARLVVAQTNANGNMSDPVVVTIFKEIIDTLKWEKSEGHTMSPREIVRTPVARKRLLIGASAGPFSCIAGNIIASYYLGPELDTAGITNTNDQLKAVSTFPVPGFSSFAYADACRTLS
jgi:hypothetical protein